MMDEAEWKKIETGKAQERAAHEWDEEERRREKALQAHSCVIFCF